MIQYDHSPALPPFSTVSLYENDRLREGLSPGPSVKGSVEHGKDPPIEEEKPRQVYVHLCACEKVLCMQYCS